MIPFTVIAIFSSLWTSCYSIPCLHSEDGKHYSGNVSVSVSGKKCHPWSWTKDMFSLRQLNLESYDDNFCRNPNGSASIWCYVSKDEVEICYVPMCTANPIADYCIAIPKVHFVVCPLLFWQVSWIQSSQPRVAFCCVRNHSEASAILPKDACLIVLIKVSATRDYFRPCLDGFHIQPITDVVLDETVIYKCCKSNETPKHTLKNFRSVGRNSSTPIWAYVSHNDSLCSQIPGFKVDTVEYLQMDKLSSNSLPPKVTICVGYSLQRSGNTLSHFQLGFMSLKDCPAAFYASNPGPFVVQYDSVILKHCWPNDHSYIYSTQSLCLNTLYLPQETLLCPDNFQSYSILTENISQSFPRFCCGYNVGQSAPQMNNLIMTNDTSISFFAPMMKCPVYKSTNPSNGFLIMAVIVPKRESNMDISYLTKYATYAPMIPICSYELQGDDFAYKKIGRQCPTGMFSSSSRFLTHESTDSTTLIEICVGIASHQNEPFPRGKYCLYKVRRHCPRGFQSARITGKGYIIFGNASLPDPNKESFCCRDDNSSVTPKCLSFPFVDSNRTHSFGLIMRYNDDVCPTICAMISHIDFEVDIPYCAYRSEEEDYLWRNEIIWPEAERPGLIDGEYITNITMEGSWHSVTPVQYRSSVIHERPSGKYCIMSANLCVSVTPYHVVEKYPVKGFYICCRLKSNKSPADRSLADRSRLKGTHHNGYVLLRGKCPFDEQDAYSLINIIRDTFNIERKRFNVTNILQLIKYGILNGVNVTDQFVTVTFQFCIVKALDKPLYEGKSTKDDVEAFITTFYSTCPRGFSKIQRKIIIDFGKTSHTLSKHFIENGSLSLCLQDKMRNTTRKGHGFGSLCEISSKECLSDLATNIFGTMPETRLHICCPEIITDKNALTINRFNFSLPLHPDVKVCPIVSNHSSLTWTITLTQTVHQRTITFCHYYETTAPSDWPSSDYFTIAYEQQCPFGFKYINNSAIELCARQTTRPSTNRFPVGNYCILTLANTPCPSTVAYYSATDWIRHDGNSLNICCSTIPNVVLNITSSEDTVFSFLSKDICSFIPGTEVKQTPLPSTLKIVQCIYTKTDSGESTNRKVRKHDLEKLSATRQYIIICLLVVILSMVLLIAIIFLICNRHRLSMVRSSKVSNMKLSAIYTVIDSFTNDRVTQEIEEDTPSVVYSII